MISKGCACFLVRSFETPAKQWQDVFLLFRHKPVIRRGTVDQVPGNGNDVRLLLFQGPEDGEGIPVVEIPQNGKTRGAGQGIECFGQGDHLLQGEIKENQTPFTDRFKQKHGKMEVLRAS